MINTKKRATAETAQPRSSVSAAGFLRILTPVLQVMLIAVAAVMTVLLFLGIIGKSQVLGYFGPLALVAGAAGFWRQRLLKYWRFQVLLAGSLVGVVAESFRDDPVANLVGHVTAKVLIAIALFGFLVVGSRKNAETAGRTQPWIEVVIVTGGVAAWFVSALPRAWHRIPNSADNLYQFVLGPGAAALVFVPAILLLARLRLTRGPTSRGPAFLAASYALQFVGPIATAAQVASADALGASPTFVLSVLIGMLFTALAVLEPSVVLLATGDAPWRSPRSWQRTAWLLLVPSAVIGAVSIGATSWIEILWPVLLLISIGLMAVRSRVTADEFIAKWSRRRNERNPQPPPLLLEDLLAWGRAVDLGSDGGRLDFGVIAVMPAVDLDEGQRSGTGVDAQIDQETLRRLRDVMRSGEQLDPTWRGEWAVCHDRDRFLVVRVSRSQLDTQDDEIFGVPRLAASFGRWLTLPFRTLSMTVRVDFSIGYSTAVLTAGSDLHAMIQEAVWAAQARGDGTPNPFDPAERAALRRRAQLGALLDDSLLDGADLSVVYEPLVDLRTGETVGAETLARWNPAGWGMVSPAEFIPIAERTKAILDLGEWVLTTACRAAVALPDPRGVSVNVSGVELARPDLVNRVMRVLQQTGLEPSKLTIEITETVVADVVEKAADGLRELVANGVQLAMDDFGTEASGLSRLLLLPWSFIKLDRSLVFGLQSADSLGASLIRAVVQLAGELGAAVVAEGVEDVRSLKLMSELGVDLVQGWVFGKGRTDLWSAWQEQRPVGFAFPQRVPVWPGHTEAARGLPVQRMGLDHPEAD